MNSLVSNCMKSLLFVFNLIFVLTGIILCVVGIVYLASYYTFKEFIDSGFFTIPSLLLSVGIIIFFVSFFGCCGAYKENYCLTVTFCTCLVAIFILELSAGIAGYILRDRADQFDTSLEKTMDFYKNESEAMVSWDYIQTNLHCCGVNNYTDWQHHGFLSPTLPKSCCSPESSSCGSNAKELNQKPCIGAIGDLLKSKATVLGGIGIGIAIIQLLGVIFSCNLATTLRKGYESV